MIQTLHIPGVIPSLNKLSSASVVTTKRGKKLTKYGTAKKAWTGRIALLARVKLKPVVAAYFTFVHVCADRRTDPDNFCGVAQKVTLDGLKKAKVIPNDGWGQVLGLAHYWSVGERPGFCVVMSAEPLSAGRAWAVVDQIETARIGARKVG
jgi:hypothetical protein